MQEEKAVRKFTIKARMEKKDSDSALSIIQEKGYVLVYF